MRDDQPDLFDALKPEVIVGAPPARTARVLKTEQSPVLNLRADAVPPAVVHVGAVGDTVLVLPFPLIARVGKIRDVASKMVATKSPRHAEAYRAQVTEALRVNLTSKRVPAELHASELRQFWQAVDLEVARILNPSRRPGGGTA